MAERKNVRTFVESLKRYDIKYNCTLPEFLRQIENIVASIPLDQRDSIIVDWTDGDSCDAGYIEFTHWRDETDAELAYRIACEKAQHVRQEKQREIQERKILNALKAKYETKVTES